MSSHSGRVKGIKVRAKSPGNADKPSPKTLGQLCALGAPLVPVL